MYDKQVSISWRILATIGGLAVVMGLAFVFLRPLIVLLPEDRRYTGLTPDELQFMHPRLFEWVGFVFRSWGAFAIGLGILIIFVAANAYRRGEAWAWWAFAVTGVLTFSIFLTVNLLLNSDFKFVIGLLLGVYVAALWLGRSLISRPGRKR